MICNKLGHNEGMQCSKIKQNHSRMIVCEEHTQYHIMGLLGFHGSHMVDLPIGEVLVPLRTLLPVNSLGLLPIGTILSHMVGNPHLKHTPKA
jgi:hypothetical protein